ncbi:OLC1v1024033C2 [Oldenlandia corymbosa var. corymbosa]|uniref:OLC1v1024033C2 n=1 Tax=Oldenlandia corymbosa var. corymbosa TaxID=529605 RepID=A0AAV1C1A7_OLDCO|nr:OLC1v1024033C2 [Oldenlandia corymbosa var. corymbosa]
MTMSRTLYTAPLSVLRQSSVKQQAKTGMESFNNDGEVAEMELKNSDGGIGDIMLMLELRKKILNFRNIISFPHCDDSVPIAELIKRTLEDLNQLNPGIVPNIKEMNDISLQQDLSFLNEALKSFGVYWSKSQLSSANSGRSANLSPDVMNSNQLGGHVIQKLDNMIKAGRQNFDIIREKTRKSNVKGSRSEMSLDDIKNTCPSPVSPRSLPADITTLTRVGSFADVSKILPPLIQAAEKCISVNIFRTVPDEFRNEKMDRRHGRNLKRAKSSAAQLQTVTATNDMSGSQNSDLKKKPKIFQLQPIAPPTVTSKSAKAEPTSQTKVPPSPLPVSPPKSSPLVQPPKTNQAAPPGPPPPPPPGGKGSKMLRLRRSDSKLKMSSHMGNLYRSLKRKLEGSNSSGSTSNKTRARVGGSSNAKQGWADALAEITRRSAYFQQIEKDVQKHSQMVIQLKDAISYFKTKDMDELVKFRGDVEKQLEQLTDETQVLARFEGFPTKKLEYLRAAASFHSKLEGMALELKNWKIEPPLDQLLDKVEKYFNKVKSLDFRPFLVTMQPFFFSIKEQKVNDIMKQIKGEIEALERTKDEDLKHFKDHDIDFDFKVMVRIKELMVDVSSGSMELALQERRKADETRRLAHIRLLWKAFQLAFRVYTFAGGQDDRADRLTKELGQVLDAIPQN